MRRTPNTGISDLRRGPWFISGAIRVLEGLIATRLLAQLAFAAFPLFIASGVPSAPACNKECGIRHWHGMTLAAPTNEVWGDFHTVRDALRCAKRFAVLVHASISYVALVPWPLAPLSCATPVVPQRFSSLSCAASQPKELMPIGTFYRTAGRDLCSYIYSYVVCLCLARGRGQWDVSLNRTIDGLGAGRATPRTASA